MKFVHNVALSYDTLGRHVFMTALCAATDTFSRRAGRVPSGPCPLVILGLSLSRSCRRHMESLLVLTWELRSSQLAQRCSRTSMQY